MATKRNPGEFDCYAAARDDEPLFVLLARDEQAPERVRDWAHKRAGRLGDEIARLGGRLPKNYARTLRKIHEAVECADAMERWRAEEQDRERQQEESRTLHMSGPSRNDVVKVNGELRQHNGRSLGDRVQVCTRKHACATAGEGPCNGMPRPEGGFTGDHTRHGGTPGPGNVGQPCCGDSPNCSNTQCGYMRFAQGIPESVEQEIDAARPDDVMLPAHKVRFTSGGNAELRERAVAGEQAALDELTARAEGRSKPSAPRYAPVCTGSCHSRGCNCEPGHATPLDPSGDGSYRGPDGAR